MKKVGIAVITVIFLGINFSNISANENGTWKEVDNEQNQNKAYVYEIENKGYAKGWNEIDNEWYYFNEITGYRVQNSWVGDYYLGADGAMLKNEWVVDKIGTTPNLNAYYVGEDGKKLSYRGCEGEWKQDQTGWQFERKDGTYPMSEFEYIDNHWYFFDSKGYMITGLFSNTENGGLYYFYSDGIMASDAGWISVSDGSWIFVNGNQCITNAITPDGYFIDETGIWKE